MKKSIIKGCLSVTMAAVVAASMIGCGNSTDTKSTDSKAADTTKVESKAPVTIKYPTYRVGTHSSAAFEKEQIAKFNEKFGNEVKVQVEEIPSDSAYNDKMKILAASGDLPDVVMGKNG